MDIIFVFDIPFIFSTKKLCNSVLFELKSWHELFLLRGDPPHLSHKIYVQELSGSYPSTCSVIGLDNAHQLISTNKIQTNNHRDLFTDVFRQVIFLQAVCVFLFFIFFTSSNRRLWLNTQTNSAPRIIGIVSARELYDDLFEPPSTLLWNYVALSCLTGKNSNKFMNLKLRPVVISSKSSLSTSIK